MGTAIGPLPYVGWQEPTNWPVWPDFEQGDEWRSFGYSDDDDYVEPPAEEETEEPAETSESPPATTEAPAPATTEPPPPPPAQPLPPVTTATP